MVNMVMVRLPRSAGWWRAAVRAKLGEAPAWSPGTETIQM